MKIEIVIEGPREALSELMQRTEGGVWDPNHLGEMKGPGNRARIIFIVEETNLDNKLLKLSRIVKDLENTLLIKNKFEFRTRNLAYTEPEGSALNPDRPFYPIPSIKIQPWHPSVQPGTDLDGIILDSHNAFGTGGHPTSRY